MGVGYWIFMGLFIFCSVSILVYKLFQISQNGKKELLDEMFDNNDISDKIYKKYNKGL